MKIRYLLGLGISTRYLCGTDQNNPVPSSIKTSVSNYFLYSDLEKKWLFLLQRITATILRLNATCELPTTAAATIHKCNVPQCTNSTQLCQQLVDGLDDVRFECGEMLSEVILAGSSRGQQLVQRFLLVCFFTATSRSAEPNRANEQRHDCRNTTFILEDTL